MTSRFTGLCHNDKIRATWFKRGKTMDGIEVWKSNTLLNAKSQWSVQEQKLFNIILSDLNEDKGKQFIITKKELEDLLGVELRSNELQKMTRSLVKKGFSIKLGKNAWSDIQIFSSIQYIDGTMTLNMTEEALPYLHVLKDFTKFMLKDVLYFKSKYSIRIFELLKREVYKKRKSFNVPVLELREFVGLKPGEYERFADFERYVLKPADTEINDQGSLKFKYEKIKKWRTVEEIRFIYEYTGEIKVPKDFNFKEFTPRQNQKLLKIATDKTIEINSRNNWSITPKEYLDEQVRKTKESKPDNTYGFLVRALEEDWAGFEEKRNLELNQISLEDIIVREKEKKPSRSKKKPKKDFDEREYDDYEALEYKLLGWEHLKK